MDIPLQYILNIDSFQMFSIHLNFSKQSQDSVCLVQMKYHSEQTATADNKCERV